MSFHTSNITSIFHIPSVTNVECVTGGFLLVTRKMDWILFGSPGPKILPSFLKMNQGIASSV